MDILTQILERKRQEVAEAISKIPFAQIRELAYAQPPVRDFTAALTKPGLQVIAEIKKASPSAGLIRSDFDPIQIAQQYERGGAAALSILTDRDFFQGDLRFISQVKPFIQLPILRKDFIIDEYQLWEARAFGADAVLLIAEALPGSHLDELYQQACDLGLHVLVELHDAEQLTRVLQSGASLIGINNRNLRTFQTDLMHTIRLMNSIPAGRSVISESGIRNHQDMLLLEQAGVTGVLVGESLMRQENPERALLTLRGQVV